MIEAFPCPTEADIVIADGRTEDGQMVKQICLILTTPTGAHVTYWSPDSAESLGEGLVKRAKEAKSGLTVVEAPSKLAPVQHNGRVTKKV